jgi:cell division protein FtsI/penicillin-binding protein 2
MGKLQGWREYQKRLQREGRRTRLLKRSLWLLPLLVLLGLGIQFFKINLSTGYFNTFTEKAALFEGQGTETSILFTKKDLRALINPDDLFKDSGEKIDLHCSDRSFSLETSLDRGLQGYMLKKIRSSQSPMIGFVAIDPPTGRILSMIDSKKVDAVKSVCLSSQFPAASIFKIVSAAAAIDGCQFSADTKLTYNGRRHTLYKNQLTHQTNRYTNKVSLKTSFARSINPVFGKLGIYRLKRELLEEYASRFGFNQPIDFELTLQPSQISVGDDPYHWAELTCGFNRETLISPVHGAMMAASIVNDGKLMEPTIIQRITDNEKETVYAGPMSIMRQVISRKASQEMKALMAATISCGTCRRTFRGYRRDPVLSKLLIGGKTGSINNKTDELHYDWFVGFCAEMKGTRKLALAVLVVHDKLLRARAQEFARLAMRYYFKKSPHQKSGSA